MTNWFYRLQQLIILILHLLLLWWIMTVLQNSGRYDTQTTMLHFVGMSLYGAFLIRGTAYWAQSHYVRELKARRKEFK
jgi:apolipoprotein N-acyltransferase